VKAFSYRLYPTNAQARAMQRQLDVARELYNACLEERREAWKHAVSRTYYDQATQLKDLRLLCPDVASVNFSMLQAVCRRAQRSYEAFYRRCQAGEKSGSPRFKGRDRFDSITFPRYGDGCKLTARLYLQGVGDIKIKLHRPTDGAIKTVTLKREGHQWFALLVCDAPTHPLPATHQSVGLDLGLTHFVTLDTGETIANPRHLRKAQAKLRRAQRSLSRKTRGGSNRHQARVRLAAQHRTVRNTRRDFHHKETRTLADRFDVICHEDLAITNMVKNHCLAQSINDAGWKQFLQLLHAKAVDAGRVCVAVNPAGTSQTCLCGARVEKTLKDRWHACSSRGLSLPRDHVSAMLIKREGHSRCGGTERNTAPVPQEAVCLS